MPRIGIILGSTRPTRVGDQVAAWVLESATTRTDAEFEIVDLRDHPLPHLDEPLPAMTGKYAHPHTKEWSTVISGFDGFVFVTSEYNGSVPGVLKNAIDHLYAEWRSKAAGLVSYGVAGGIGAAGQLRQICGQLGMADVPTRVTLMLHTDFEGFTTLNPAGHHTATLASMLDEVVAWTEAMAPLRDVGQAGPERLPEPSEAVSGPAGTG